MDITKKQVEQWCYDNKHTVIDFSNIINISAKKPIHRFLAWMGGIAAP